MTSCNQGFQVDRVGLSGNLIQNLAAFRFNGGFVEVEESVGIQENFACGRSDHRSLSLGDWYAVAAGAAGSGGPEIAAPAQFVCGVFPTVAHLVAPFNDRLHT